LSTKTRIISVSRRTDIPAHYWPWFKNRIRAGFCTTFNPFNPKQVKKISLSPVDVDVFVFWTRNPTHILEDEDFFNKFNTYFLFTITGYPDFLERNLPPLNKSIELFKRLSRRLVPGSVVWRYDPIIISSEMDFEYHTRMFAEIAEKLRDFTGRVIISIFDPYKKSASRLAALNVDYIEREELFGLPGFSSLMSFMKKTADECGLEIMGCCETLSEFGIARGRCIDDNLINRLFHIGIEGKKDKSQRKTCGCIESTDIGAYNTCIHGCEYCYAVKNFEIAKRMFERHDEKCDSLVNPGTI